MSIRLAFVLLSLTAIGGCSLVGAPERASDTQNPNAISDDIAALSMTRSDVMHAADPMARTALPKHYQVQQE